MGADQNLDWRCAMISALEWWHDAGVDTLVDDLPREWLAAPARTAPVARAIDTSGLLPTTLTALLDWRNSVDAPEATWGGNAIPSSGPADATVMVLVNCPDSADGPDGLLSGGEAGRLFGRILAAIGLSRDTVHVAALCMKRPRAGRVPRGMEERLSEIAQRHIALVAPKRLLVLGDAASCSILGANVAAMRGALRPFNHDGGTTEVVSTFHPELLLKRPECKAMVWKDLRMLVEGL